MISFGLSTLPVLSAGQCSVQRPHSTQEKACSASMRVTSLPVSRPKSSSPASGGIRLKPCALEKHGDRTQHQVQMLGVRNQRQENQQRQRVQPPARLARQRFLVDPEPGQIGRHQDEDQECDEARFRRHFAQPHRPHHEAADEQPRDRDRHRHRPHRHEAEIEAAEARIRAIRNRAPNADAM